MVLPAFLQGFSLRAFADSHWMNGLPGLESDRVLVLIQLNGGNDGLNTVIPIDLYEAYRSARENIAIPQQKILRLEGMDATGLNPAMTGMQTLFKEQRLSIIQSVSYPNPIFSHFRATDIWLSGANANEEMPTGWAGRYLDHAFRGFPNGYPNSQMRDPLAIQIGGIVSPALQGPTTTMGMAISNPTNFYDLINSKSSFDSETRAGDQLAYIRETSLMTDQYADVIKNAAKKVKKQSDQYPAPGRNPLADQLKIVARLIAGGLNTKIYMVNMGGFDTHSAQTDRSDTTIGAHGRLLARLSEAITAFMKDVNELRIADRVLGMTFSEFGRRILSNASGGTDHGAAAPVFLFGNKVKGGILGTNPTLPATATVKDNIPMQYDFRSVYASILEKWFGADAQTTAAILLSNYQSLPILDDGLPGNDTNAMGTIFLQHPGQFAGDIVVIHFQTMGGHTALQVFDGEGRLVNVLMDQHMDQGKYSHRLHTDRLSAGIYYTRLQNGMQQKVNSLEKING